ncbi:alkene reductase [Nocardioides iriomotensis]|uniref:Alkene reductase n=1 Tax=Nocardioides iriomotensis TaxID=715784 RepID=A0A4Q5J3A6_9ACTN|nr:alkene reductase [Nocardioides iriomotensis]RYU12863.1 alkene reductase [Nocardioides iriomotensis]
MSELFAPLTMKSWDLPHRILLAPMTRSRAAEGMVPTELTAEYYAQRASAALIVTEGTQPSAVGQGYLTTPGLHTDEQVEGWRRVADAVHARDGRIVAQIMHAGRVAHPDNKGGLETVAPSAVQAPGQMFTAHGMQPMALPRELATEEIPGVVEEFAQAARNAVAAGLDGVEVHGANGYLIHQFLAPSTNVRTDGYGGSPAARARFAIEVVTAVAEAIGPDKVGLRISPGNGANGAVEDDADDLEATYSALVEGIAPLGIAYLSVHNDPREDLVKRLRGIFGGTLVANDGFANMTSKESAQQMLDLGLADAVAVGRQFLANPDLPRRWELDAELNEPDPATFYGGDHRGYTDYPALSA